jgi:hypothetical protein
MVMELEVIEEKAEKLATLIDSSKYPQTFNLLHCIAEYGLDDLDYFIEDVMCCDETLPMHTLFASFVEEVFIDEINKGNDGAMCNLGSLYYTGRIGTQDFEKGVYYYEMSARLGNRQAQENLGYCYYYGRVGEPDYKKAYHYFIKGALDGHLISLYKVGDMYKNGYYVEKDEKEAFYIYKHCLNYLSDEQNEKFGADIYIRIADCYYYGIGTEKDLRKALKFYQDAEFLYYNRIKDGDFLYKKQYSRCIQMQEAVRKEMQKEIPSYDWVKKEY